MNYQIKNGDKVKFLDFLQSKHGNNVYKVIGVDNTVTHHPYILLEGQHKYVCSADFQKV